jgi:hypothetical protein
MEKGCARQAQATTLATGVAPTTLVPLAGATRGTLAPLPPTATAKQTTEHLSGERGLHTYLVVGSGELGAQSEASSHTWAPVDSEDSKQGGGGRSAWAVSPCHPHTALHTLRTRTQGPKGAGVQPGQGSPGSHHVGGGGHKVTPVPNQDAVLGKGLAGREGA